MSARKRHTMKYDFLRQIAPNGAVSHCLGGADVTMLERLEKQGLVRRWRKAYGRGWMADSNYSLYRTHWEITPKGFELLRKLDGNRMAPMRLHRQGTHYGDEGHTRWKGDRYAVPGKPSSRERDEKRRNDKMVQRRLNIVNPKGDEEPVDQDGFFW